jgi:hypothetical protein
MHIAILRATQLVLGWEARFAYCEGHPTWYFEGCAGKAILQQVCIPIAILCLTGTAPNRQMSAVSSTTLHSGSPTATWSSC